MRAELIRAVVALLALAALAYVVRQLRRRQTRTREQDDAQLELLTGCGDESAAVLPLDGVLDLHGFAARDVKSLVPEWIDACRAQGLRELRIVHGKGRGALRRSVHAILSRRGDVLSYRLAPPERGGWGATLVTLRDRS